MEGGAARVHHGDQASRRQIRPDQYCGRRRGIASAWDRRWIPSC